MPTIHLVSDSIDDERRGRLVYRGDLLIFKNLRPLHELCDLSRRIIGEHFGNTNPESAQFEMEGDDYSKTVVSLQKEWTGDSEVRRLLFGALEAAGVDPEHNYRDWLYLRVLPHGDAHQGVHMEKVAPHRDTWASNLIQQTNWWTPLYPVTEERTIVFFVEYWSKPIENSSGEWDLDNLRALREQGVEPGADALLPLTTESVDPKSELRMVIEPGDLLCFSGAHLHASIPNHSGAARFSTEIRTVNIDDIRESRGAPNVDGASVKQRTEWFRRLSDGKPLTETLEEK